MFKSFSLACSFTFFLSFITSMVQADMTGIPTGFQLQEDAEKKTQKITTADLKKMLNDELDINNKR